MAIDIKTFFDENTATFTHVVSDKNSNKAAIIDSVLDYDQYSGKVSFISANKVIDYVKEKNLTIEWILETHIHADHLTAASYLQEKLGGKTAIGCKIKDVLNVWVPIFNTKKDTDLNATQFDHLFLDNDIFTIGTVPVKVMHTPGHTPACASYVIEDAVFVGDTIFMPDIGTARTDFPGGSSKDLYDSITKKILSLPPQTRIFLCHDYPPNNSREVTFVTTVQEQKEKNVLLHDGISKDEYVKVREKRDEGKAVPKLLLPSIQVNLRGGKFGLKEDNGKSYIKIPVEDNNN